MLVAVMLARVMLAPIVLALGGCGGSGPAAPDGAALRGPGPSLLLITLDTTRADRLGAYGHAAAQTPALDGLAARGLLFERAWAAAPITLPSHATLLSGLYPHEHGARDNGLYHVPDAVHLLPEALSARGWHTGAFLGSVVLAPRYGLDQGFDVYDAPRPGAGGDAEGGVERRAAEVVDAALAWSAALPAGERFLMWVHLFDPHARYEPPEPYASRLADPYDGEIAYADSQVARLLEGLAAQGKDGALAVVATADHGEGLGEHGEPTHGIFLHDATMRVPLIVVPPGGLRGEPAGGRRSRAAVSLADVPATALALLGLPADALPAARTPSLLRSAELAELAEAAGADQPEPGRALYLESLLPFHQHRWHPLRGAVWDGLKLIDTPRPELYALDADPGELHDVSLEQPARLAAARGALAELLARHRPVEAAAQPPTQAERESLEALGYLGGAVEGDPFDATLPLPRDRADQIVPKLETARLLRDGLEALEAGAPHARALLDDARGRLQDLLVADPDDPQAAGSLGSLEIALGRHAEAIGTLERLALVEPRSARTRYSLAICYEAVGRGAWAMHEMLKAAAVDPTWPLPARWLAERHLAQGDQGRALWWLLESARRRRGRADDARSRDEAIDRLADALAGKGVAPVPPDGFPPDDLRPEGLRATR